MHSKSVKDANQLSVDLNSKHPSNSEENTTGTKAIKPVNSNFFYQKKCIVNGNVSNLLRSSEIEIEWKEKSRE